MATDVGGDFPRAEWGIGRMAGSHRDADDARVRTTPQRRAALALVGLTVLPACGEVQPAEPLAKTVPVALAMVALVVVGAATAHRQLWARFRRGPVTQPVVPLRFPRLVVVLALAPAAACGAILLFLAGVVALGYRQAHTNVLTWADTVAIATIVGAVTFALAAVGSAVAAAAVSEDRVRRARGRTGAVAFAVVTGVVAPPLLVATLPLAILSGTTDPRRLPPPWVTGPGVLPNGS